MAEAKPDRSVPNRGAVAGVRLIAKCRLYQASQQASLLNSSSLSSLYFPLIAMSAPVETVPAPVAAEAPKVTDDTTKDEPAPATVCPLCPLFCFCLLSDLCRRSLLLTLPQRPRPSPNPLQRPLQRYVF